MLNDLTINNAGYYASNSEIASDAQGDITHDPKTGTHTNNGKENVMDTSNGNFEQKIEEPDPPCRRPDNGPED